jgi:hypothetical protein
VQSAPADQIAGKETSLFPGIDRGVLAATIAAYQKIGCWRGDIHITRDLYAQALEVFLHGGAIQKRHAYEEVVTAPPE